MKITIDVRYGTEETSGNQYLCIEVCRDKKRIVLRVGSHTCLVEDGEITAEGDALSIDRFIKLTKMTPALVYYHHLKGTVPREFS